jgi:ferric-dicitrate binding protein FerR (iron transport regulator)
VGTAFNVRLAAAAVEVLVTEGQVAVADSAAPGSAGRAAIPLLGAGQRATVPLQGPAAPEIVAVTRAETDRLLAWQPQLLDFSSAPLAFAVAELNRRNRVQFVIADPELAAMPIIASIRSDKVDGFAQFLAATPGVQVERRGGSEIVLRRKP